MGSRPLGVYPPKFVQETHIMVLSLSELERAAIWLYYVAVMRDDNRCWTIEERCDMAGIARDTLSKRLQRAKLRLLGVKVE